jgi:hypothetical protein
MDSGNGCARFPDSRRFVFRDQKRFLFVRREPRFFPGKEIAARLHAGDEPA